MTTVATVKTGKRAGFKLMHGTSEREFRDVEIRKFSDDEGQERWELTGIEKKVEAVAREGEYVTEIVEVPVTVGFLPENVVK